MTMFDQCLTKINSERSMAYKPNLSQWLHAAYEYPQPALTPSLKIDVRESRSMANGRRLWARLGLSPR